MKKLFSLAILLFFFASCERILKDPGEKEVVVATDHKVVFGTEKDAKGCVTSAGYRWSAIRKECIRVFEEGYRLNTITELKGESISKSAFVIFEDNGNMAELYLPDGSPSILLKREKEGSPYKSEIWTLELQDSYSLIKDGQVEFAAAKIEENQITGDENQES